MKKKTILFLLAFILAFTSCEKREYTGADIENFDEVSKSVCDALKKRSYRINVTFKAKVKDPDREKIAEIAEEIYKASMKNSPDPKAGDYLKYQTGGYEVRYKNEERFTGTEHTIGIIPDYYTTAEEEEEVDIEIERLVSEIKESLGGEVDTGDPKDVKRAVYISHDIICDRVSYDSVHGSGNYGHIGATAYCALHYNLATCQGYSVLMYRLLKELGIENRIVTGDFTDASGEKKYHAWNVVSVGEEELAVDVTIDDERNSREYLLITQEEISKDHKEIKD